MCLGALDLMVHHASVAAVLNIGQFPVCRVPSCPKCDTGILKPYVVFFGDNVPKPRVESVRRQVEQSDALLVVGSSLFVFSGYRLDVKYCGAVLTMRFADL